MERVGFLGRIMLILMAALLVMIAATVGIDHLAGRNAAPSFAQPFPRVVHAAGIIALIRGADPARRAKVIRFADNASVRVTITDAPAKPGADDIRDAHLETRLRAVIGTAGGGVEAYTDPAMAFPRSGPRVSGRLTKAIASLDGGGSLVVEWIDPPRMTAFTLLGLPPNAWAGILGFAVAALALVIAFREVRPLQSLTRSVTAFDGSPPTAPVEEKGAPDIRRLARAVHGMQERLAALLAERSFLIGAISHDLRTYLTRMRLRTETIADDESRERMVGDLDAMTQLIDTSLAFARGTTSSRNRVTLDLADLVAVEVEEHAALGLAPTLRTTYEGDALVVGDPVALRRVVCNVLDNALKFARTTVTVRVERTASHGLVVVEDDGPGIPEPECRSVFSPFYRVERSRSRSTGGTGLGLAIARQIVEAHAGTIEAGAVRPQGAVFTITLPAVARAERSHDVTKRHSDHAV